MKKLMLLLFTVVAGLAPFVHASDESVEGYVTISSWSVSDSRGPVMFSSGTIQFVGVTIYSPAVAGYISFYRSTSSVFTNDIATQTMIACNWSSVNTNPVFIPLFYMSNSSFTYVQRNQACNATIWFKWPDLSSNPVKVGLPWNGQK